MKLKTQTPQKGKASIAAANGKASKVQKVATPAKSPAVAAAVAKNKTPKKLPPPKKLMEVEEDDDESEEEEEEDLNGGAQSEEEDNEGEEVGDSDDEDDEEDDDDEDEEEEDDDEDDEEESEVLNKNGGLIDEEAEEASEDDEDDDKAEEDDSDDEAPEEAPVGKKAAEKEDPSNVPIINFKVIPTGTPIENIIHLKRLPPMGEYNHGDLANVFSKYGKMTAIVLYPGIGVSTALIAFTNAEEAKVALASAKDVKIKGHPIEVHPKKEKVKHDKELSVYVHNISNDTTEEDLQDFFAECGKITLVVIRNKERGKRFAMVQFAEASSVSKAKDLTSKQLKDQEVVVTLPFQKKDDDNANTVVLKNPEKLTSINENKITKILGKCGAIRNVNTICTANVLAFVTFENEKDVEAALALNGQVVDGIQLEISKYNTETNQRYYILLVQNLLNPATSESPLRKLFSKCGEVGKILIDKTRNSATIQFMDKEAYCKAFLFNEHVINKQPIFLQPYSKIKHTIRIGKKPLKRLNHNKPFGKFNPTRNEQKEGNQNGAVPPFFRKGGPRPNGGPGFKKNFNKFPKPSAEASGDSAPTPATKKPFKKKFPTAAEGGKPAKVTKVANDES